MHTVVWTINDVFTSTNVRIIIAVCVFVLQCIGEDPNRDGLLDTPQRAAKALQFLSQGYCLSAQEVIGSGVFRDGTEGNLVIVKDIDMHSLCEHHMLPFTGKVNI